MDIDSTHPYTAKWSAIDFFIHKRVRENSDFFYRGRIMVFILLAEIAVSILMACALLFEPIPGLAFDHALALTLIGIVPQIVLLYLLKKYGNYTLCALLLITQGFLAIACVTVFSGGPFDSLATQLMGVPCLMAFYFCGRRWGVAFTIMTLFSMTIFMVMQSLGFQFSTVIRTTSRSFSEAFVLAVDFGIVTTLALAYELTFFLVKKEHDQEHEKFLQLAKTDPLTGLANRRIFDETLAARIALYSKLTPVRSFGLCYLDLDEFKPINDRFGHDVGDEVLRVVSARLRSALRGADFIGRYGGDEFLMLLDSVHDSVTAVALLQRFLQLIREPIKTSAGVVHVGGSLGFAIFPLHDSDVATLQKAADNAMYEAKRNHSGFMICPA